MHYAQHLCVKLLASYTIYPYPEYIDSLSHKFMLYALSFDVQVVSA
jgi:hypothetical protein